MVDGRAAAQIAFPVLIDRKTRFTPKNEQLIFTERDRVRGSLWLLVGIRILLLVSCQFVSF